MSDNNRFVVNDSSEGDAVNENCMRKISNYWINAGIFIAYFILNSFRPALTADTHPSAKSVNAFHSPSLSLSTLQTLIRHRLDCCSEILMRTACHHEELALPRLPPSSPHRLWYHRSFSNPHLVLYIPISRDTCHQSLCHMFPYCQTTFLLLLMDFLHVQHIHSHRNLYMLSWSLFPQCRMALHLNSFLL